MNPNECGVVLDGYTLVIDGARWVFRNQTVLHPQDTLKISYGVMDQMEAGKSFVIKAKPPKKSPVLLCPDAKTALPIKNGRNTFDKE